MIEIEKTLISDDVLEEKFLCDLKACKGACCVEGDSGAPLEEQELSILDDEYENIKPFLSEEGKIVIEKNGKYELDTDGDHVTPLVRNADCAYVIYDNNGITKCGIEKAYEQGATTFKKPISCHLYPIRLNKYETFTAVNYHEWEICKAAKLCGSKQKLPLVKFLKEPLIRKFGKDWYNKLEDFVPEQQ